MLYKELAKYYDLIYSWKDYKRDTAKIKKFISQYKKSNGNKLLDVACGTGHHLKYLKSKFSCCGIDINQTMLKIAKKNVKGVVFRRADMKNFCINKKFDIIICLFGSVAYVKTYKNLRQTIKNFSNHLKKGGIAIIEEWIRKSEFKKGHVYMNTYDDENIKLARIGTSKLRANDIVEADMYYLVGEKGKSIRYFSDKHELGLFDSDEILNLMKQVGFKAKFFKKGLMKDRGIYIGVKI